MSIQGLHRLNRLSGVALGAALAATLLAQGVAAAEPLAPTTCQSASVIIVAGGTSQPACVSQNGNTLVIVLNGTGQSTTVPGPSTAGSGQSTTVPGQSAPEPDMTAVNDPRVDSYAKRQAIRDQYRGRIDEVTFNDELGDGVPLDQALADAIQALQKGHS